MNKEKVIYEIEPRTTKWNIKFNLIFAAVIFVLAYLFSSELWIPLMISGVILLFSMIASELEQSWYDGIKIETNRLILSRNSLFGLRSIEVLFSEVTKIVYSERMPRKPRFLKVISNIQNYKVYVRFDIFEFADTLKYLKNQGLNIEFERRDHEIELYLNDKIDKIPMQNITDKNDDL